MIRPAGIFFHFGREFPGKIPTFDDPITFPLYSHSCTSSYQISIHVPVCWWWSPMKSILDQLKYCVWGHWRVSQTIVSLIPLISHDWHPTSIPLIFPLYPYDTTYSNINSHKQLHSHYPLYLMRFPFCSHCPLNSIHIFTNMHITIHIRFPFICWFPKLGVPQFTSIYRSVFSWNKPSSELQVSPWLWKPDMDSWMMIIIFIYLNPSSYPR